MQFVQADEARKHVRAALVGFIEVFGTEHVLTLKARHNDAMIAIACGQTAEGCQGYEEVLALRRDVLGPEHVDTLKTSCNLALALVESDIYRAEDLYRSTLSGLERVVGRSHFLFLTALQNLSVTIVKRSTMEGKPIPVEAEEMAREAAECRQRTLGADHPDTMASRRDLGYVFMSCGKLDEAEAAFRQALERYERLLGFDHPMTKNVMMRLHELLCKQGRPDQARKVEEDYKSSTAVSDAPALPKVAPERGILVAVILNLYIAPHARRKGVGRCAVLHWKKLAKELRCDAVEVEVSSEADDALAFFASCGFADALVTDALAAKGGVSGGADSGGISGVASKRLLRLGLG